MFLCPVVASKMSKTIILPSGDHLGSKQPWEVGSERAPPQATPWTWISCSPLPSECTTQSVLCTSAVSWREKTIWFPCGDQSPPPPQATPWTWISCSPLPSECTTQSVLCTSAVSWREKTIWFPCGDQSPPP